MFIKETSPGLPFNGISACEEFFSTRLHLLLACLPFGLESICPAEIFDCLEAGYLTPGSLIFF